MIPATPNITLNFVRFTNICFDLPTTQSRAGRHSPVINQLDLIWRWPVGLIQW